MKNGDHRNWTFLTNHSHVLISLAHDPDRRLRDVAADVGITERAVHRIVAELEEAGYLKRIRKGRRNFYQVNKRLPLRHPIEQHSKVGDLIKLIHSNSTMVKPSR